MVYAPFEISITVLKTDIFSSPLITKSFGFHDGITFSLAFWVHDMFIDIYLLRRNEIMFYLFIHHIRYLPRTSFISNVDLDNQISSG